MKRMNDLSQCLKIEMKYVNELKWYVQNVNSRYRLDTAVLL